MATILLHRPMGITDLVSIPDEIEKRGEWRILVVPAPQGLFRPRRDPTARTHRILRARPTGEVEVTMTPNGVRTVPIWLAEFE